MTTDQTDDEIKTQVTERLKQKFPDAPDAEIRSIVDEEFSGLADRPIRDFLGVLTERFAKKRLKKS